MMKLCWRSTSRGSESRCRRLWWLSQGHARPSWMMMMMVNQVDQMRPCGQALWTWHRGLDTRREWLRLKLQWQGASFVCLCLDLEIDAGVQVLYFAIAFDEVNWIHVCFSSLVLVWGFWAFWTWSERVENEREERDVREDIILRYIILLCRYIILMSKKIGRAHVWTPVTP